MAERAQFFWSCIDPVLKFFLLVWTMLGVLTWCRDEGFLPAQLQHWRVIDLLPSWPWYLWVTLGLLIVALALGEGAFRNSQVLKAARSGRLFDQYGNPCVSVVKTGPSRFVAPLILLLIIIVAWIYGPEVSAIQRPEQTAKPVATNIFMECDWVSLPITIPPYTTLHLIPLNKKRMQSVKWGFYKVPNDSNLERQWPDKKIMKKAMTAHNLALFIYRCEVSNHGALNVFDIDMPIKFHYGNEKVGVTYKVIITPLDAGTSFVFYPINDCPESVSAIWPDTVTLQVLGEGHPRKEPLRRTFKNSMDQIMMYFRANTRFFGGEPCE